MISALECFHYATLELVRSAPIKQRLIFAYRRHLAILPEEQLPSEIRDPFRRVMQSLRGVQPLRGEDAVAASVRKMSSREADECAALIVEMFGLFCRLHLTNGRLNGTVVRLHGEDSDSGYQVPALIASN